MIFILIFFDKQLILLLIILSLMGSSFFLEILGIQGEVLVGAKLEVAFV
ncbi:TPA: hypothetical protein ACXLVH_002741 [Legionella anisa]|nr:hypothetical protein [Legionella anisa]MCW8448638.1 hypothetical protein [Legionella anisa]